MPVLDLGLILGTFPIDPDLIRGKSQPLFPSGGLHSSHQHSPPYLLLSLRLSLPLLGSRILLTFCVVFFFFCSCWRFLVEAGINFNICRFLFKIWTSVVSDFRLKLKSYLCLRRIYVSWLTVAALASRTSHGSEVSCWNQFKWSETLFQLSRV